MYIDRRARPSADSLEISEGVVLDVDAAGHPVGIDIQHASAVLDLSTLETRGVPALSVRLA